MTEGWSSDWEKLFAKCATDTEYRQRLRDALVENNRERVTDLLASIDVEVSDGRIDQLTRLINPWLSTAETFGSPKFASATG